MNIKIKSCDYGRGVFATQSIRKGDVIESCPVLLLPELYANNDLEDQLARFQFDWINGLKCVALGFGSIYNHSENANALFLPNYEDQTIIFIATKDISSEEQILTDYGYDPILNSPIETEIKNKSLPKSSLSKFMIDQTIRALKS